MSLHMLLAMHCNGSKWVTLRTFRAHRRYRESDKDAHFASFTSEFGVAKPPRQSVRMERYVVVLVLQLYLFN